MKKVKAFKLNMTRERARYEAEKKGTKVWKAVFAGMPLNDVRLMYVEYMLFDVKLRCKLSILRKLGRAKNETADGSGYVTKTMRVICNGTTCRAALVENLPQMVKVDLDKVPSYQESDYTEDEMRRSAEKICVKYMHRLIGGVPQVVGTECVHVYGPFYVAYYGKSMEEGNKVRYLTFPADTGKTSKRGEYFQNAKKGL